MIAYAHSPGSSQATLYVYLQGRGFVPSINIPLKDLHYEIATLLRVKARLAGQTVNVYLSNGQIIDEPA